MEKPNVTQLELFDQEGNPIVPSSNDKNKKEESTVLMTVEEREEWKEGEPQGEYEKSWQGIYNR